jgi:diacylglycerol kinase family enzyme
VYYIHDIKALVAKAPVFTGKHVRITLIANPVAGGFTIQKRAKQNEAFFASALTLIRDRKEVAASCSLVVHLTTHAGHGGNLAEAVIQEALASKDDNELFLLVTAGGDGTSHDVQTRIARAVYERGHTSLSDKICLLRLPFGTGNDGSDGRTLDESLALLTGPAHLKKNRAIRVYHQGNKDHPWYSFNITSVGIDAFITHMTNRVKRILPGDFYKLWIDLACLFYNKLYDVGTMRVTATKGKGESVGSWEGKLLLQCMGYEGNRAYGSNQKILPDDNNLCAVREMPLLMKLKLKGTLKSGSHLGLPQTVFCKADRIVIDYDRKILTQQDGEAHLLGPEHFPLTMELTEPLITCIAGD